MQHVAPLVIMPVHHHPPPAPPLPLTPRIPAEPEDALQHRLAAVLGQHVLLAHTGPALEEVEKGTVDAHACALVQGDVGEEDGGVRFVRDGARGGDQVVHEGVGVDLQGGRVGGGVEVHGVEDGEAEGNAEDDESENEGVAPDGGEVIEEYTVELELDAGSSDVSTTVVVDREAGPSTELLGTEVELDGAVVVSTTVGV